MLPALLCCTMSRSCGIYACTFIIWDPVFSISNMKWLCRPFPKTLAYARVNCYAVTNINVFMISRTTVDNIDYVVYMQL